MTQRGRARLAAMVGAMALAVPLLGMPALAAPGDPTPASSQSPTPGLSPTPSQGPGLTADGKPVCAIRDLTFVPLPRTSPMPARKSTEPAVGGEALTSDGLVVPPGSPPLPGNLAATSWLVADLDTGEVLGACGAHRYQVPASVQKVLLAATVLPKLDPAKLVQITDEDVRGWGQEPNASSIWAMPGEVYPVEELFLGLLLRSGNDAANALARVAGGDRGVAGTIEDMNAMARRLGAWDTHAATPSGLDPHQLPDELKDDYQVTSAYDLALIFREAFKYEAFRTYLMAPAVHLDAQPQTGRAARAYETLVKFNDFYPDGLGGKTGYTELARHSFVGARERGGRRLVATILGGERIPADNNAFKQAGALIDWGFSLPRGTSVGHLVAPGEADALIAAKAPPSRAPIVVVPPVGSGSSGLLLLAAGVVAVVVLAGATTGGLVWRRRRVLATVGSPPAPDVPSAPEMPEAAAPETGGVPEPGGVREPGAVPEPGGVLRTGAPPEAATAPAAAPAPEAPEPAEPAASAAPSGAAEPSPPATASPKPDLSTEGDAPSPEPPPPTEPARGVAKVRYAAPPGPYPGQPLHSAQPADQPPMDQPPMDQPPMDQPPMDQPPMDQPPMDQPPMDQPPMDQPPMDQPPPAGG